MTDSCAAAGLLFARFREQGHDADRVALRQFVIEHPSDAHAARLLHELQAVSASPQAPSLSVPLESPARKQSNWRVTAQAWAIALSGVIASEIWPAALGDWWALPVITCFGLGIWFWSRSVRPRIEPRRT